ncbi:MAG: glutamate--tRNA ligase [Candidatus Babeliales bacterium]
MKNNNEVRVRFAASPHRGICLGDVRGALINYLVALFNRGKYILRIEDVVVTRASEDAYAQTVSDLAWLGITYHEGPMLQSERTAIYEEQLQELIRSQRAYRCFCTPDMLEENHRKQLGYGQPPRYDRTCLKLSDDKIKAKIAAGLPFIWRFKLNEFQLFEFDDLAKGPITFEMKHYSDFALTKSGGSFTPLFASFVDDWQMGITHIIRGEDQLSKTAQQATLYDAFAVQLPRFWHLPQISDTQGHPLIHDDPGFMVQELRDAGFLPQALCNYVAMLCYSFEPEIQSLQELAGALEKTHIHATSSVKFDRDKLTWINHKWIQRLTPEELAPHLTPFIHKQYPESTSLGAPKIIELIRLIQPELRTFEDVKQLLTFYFADPATSRITFNGIFGYEKAQRAAAIVEKHKDVVGQSERFLTEIKTDAEAQGLDSDDMFSALRYLMTGMPQGIAVHDLCDVLEQEKMHRRIERGLAQ